ncbi:MAG: TIGR03808 family TAT-translocated repetitive protein [Hyphomicrobium sp.]
MTQHIAANRRNVLAAALGLGAATSAMADNSKRSFDVDPSDRVVDGLVPNADYDQTAILQAAIDRAAGRDEPVTLPPGAYRVSDLRLRAGTRLLGAAHSARLVFGGGPAFVAADKADDLVVRGVIFDGQWNDFDAARGDGLLSIARSKSITIDDVEFRNSAQCGLSLDACSGRVTHATIVDVSDAGLKSLDGSSLDIRNSTLTDCGNNGILIWRREKGEDGATVVGNRISNIRNASGGSGQYGNGVNVFRAGGVLVANNIVTDCAYSAVRGNAADNIQIIANRCERLGEVALYAEFGFEGALIANNVIHVAASGVSVTNFNEGGRLAVIQGNLIRNLARREFEAIDRRGEGISVEADAAISGNTIEGAPTVGVQIGWGPYMRDVAVTGNVIRRAKIGVSITADAETGACLIANNLISNFEDGAIRRMRLGKAFGPDLARNSDGAGNVAVLGNVAV